MEDNIFPNDYKGKNPLNKINDNEVLIRFKNVRVSGRVVQDLMKPLSSGVVSVGTLSANKTNFIDRDKTVILGR